MHSISEPLEFRKYMRAHPTSAWDSIPWLDVLLIVVFIATQSAWFVTAPGTSLQLPQGNSSGAFLREPTAILSVGPNELYFFDGEKVSQVALAKRLNEFVLRSRSVKSEVTLLIKADQQVPLQLLFNLMEYARMAGFSMVHLASEPGLLQDVTKPIPDREN